MVARPPFSAALVGALTIGTLLAAALPARAERLAAEVEVKRETRQALHPREVLRAVLDKVSDHFGRPHPPRGTPHPELPSRVGLGARELAIDAVATRPERLGDVMDVIPADGGKVWLVGHSTGAALPVAVIDRPAHGSGWQTVSDRRDGNVQLEVAIAVDHAGQLLRRFTFTPKTGGLGGGAPSFLDEAVAVDAAVTDGHVRGRLWTVATRPAQGPLDGRTLRFDHPLKRNGLTRVTREFKDRDVVLHFAPDGALKQIAVTFLESPR